ncbi:hypothetical protein [Burkholderia pseudomultivorans]|uniref:hypothetical protein n=1 Tax=Burkholderia pseudomultivorans TaxID=1207504 RepID=UPI001E3B1038|nr:hypothetical protein [Burkholderia pseudomultivorans]
MTHRLRPYRLSIIGIPLLSFVMDPVTAGGLLVPLFIAMDLFAPVLEAFDLIEAGPCAALTGAGDRHRLRLPDLSFFLDHRAIAILMAVITLIFADL